MVCSYLLRFPKKKDWEGSDTTKRMSCTTKIQKEIGEKIGNRWKGIKHSRQKKETIAAFRGRATRGHFVASGVSVEHVCPCCCPLIGRASKVFTVHFS